MSPKLETVEGLRSSDFALTENRIPRKICDFAHIRLPSSIGILLDTSASMSTAALDRLALGRAVINQLLDTSGPQDEYFLEYVSTGPSMQCIFSCNLAHIRARLQTASAGGRTALIDAVYLALNAMRKARHTNRALLVVSDGDDNHSVYEFNELRQALSESPIPIFLVIPTEKYFALREYWNKVWRFDPAAAAMAAKPRDLVQFVNRSGGYTVGVWDEQMLAATTQLASAIRSPYSLYFQSPISRGPAPHRNVRIEVKGVRPRPMVLYRALYYPQQP